MLNKAVQIKFFQTCRKAAFTILTVASLLLQTGCKDDDDKIVPDHSQQQNDPSAIIPARDKKYSYKATDADGSISTEVIRVKNVSDSAGFKVSNMETLISDGQEQVAISWKAYSKDGVTTNEISLPAAFSDLVNQIKELGSVKDFKLTGFPQYQLRENKASPGSKLTFKGEDIRLYVKLEVEDEEGEIVIVEIESTVTYEDGQLVKIENVTTPAGTFTCSKWEYGYSTITKISYNGTPGEQTNELYDITDWTAPGIGVVKSIESTIDAETVTELQKID